MKLRKALHEHVSYKSYTLALKRYLDWNSHYVQKPEQCKPLTLPTAPSDEIQYSIMMENFRVSYERWTNKNNQLAGLAEDELQKMLRFISRTELSGENNNLDELKKTCIPEGVWMLHKVLHCTGQFERW